VIAERFGCLPHEVEKMPAWWYHRIVEYIEGETIARKEQQAQDNRRRK
jgi:hypothetical protein